VHHDDPPGTQPLFLVALNTDERHEVSRPIPHLVVNDGVAAIQFYEAAFGAARGRWLAARAKNPSVSVALGSCPVGIIAK
jgi:hypothetical protein